VIQFIKQALLQQPSKRDLVNVLIKNMGRHYPERSHKTVHASDVTKPGFCPRQYRLMDVLGLERPDRYVPPALQATFDVGNMTARLVTDEWMGQSVIGHWECVRCTKERLWEKKPQKTQCAAGGHCQWTYKEVQFVHSQSGMSGSIDMMADLGQSVVTAVELKIIKPEDFASIVGPLAEHRVRTRVYLKLIAESTSQFRHCVDTSHAKVMYVSRGFGKKHAETGMILPFKEYDVLRDDQSVQPYFDLAQSVADARKTQKMITFKPCDSLGCSQAKACPVVQQCFSGEYDHG
jgi:hypothetical protein